MDEGLPEEDDISNAQFQINKNIQQVINRSNTFNQDTGGDLMRGENAELWKKGPAFAFHRSYFLLPSKFIHSSSIFIHGFEQHQLKSVLHAVIERTFGFEFRQLFSLAFFTQANNKEL